MSQKPSQILENLKTALPAVVQHIKDSWDNVQSLFIKTNSSVSLPIWTCNLDDSNEGRWDGLTAKVEEEQGGSRDEEEVESDAEPTPEVKRTNDAKTKGKRRVSEDHKNEDEPNKKRKKNADDASKRKVNDSPSEPSTPPKNKASITPQTMKTSKSNKAAKQKKKKIDPSSESDASGMVPIQLTIFLPNRIAQMK